MLITLKRDHDRYIVYGREGDTGEERIGFVRKDGNTWNAVDTTMEHSQDFRTRAEAIAWLEKLAITS